MKKPTDIDGYIAGFPPATQVALERVRETIRTAAPEAEETISYAIAAYRLNDRNLVYFAGFKEHVGLYPLPKENAALQARMAPYQAGKGTLRFPLNKKMPLALIAAVVKQHVKENNARAVAKKKR